MLTENLPSTPSKRTSTELEKVLVHLTSLLKNYFLCIYFPYPSATLDICPLLLCPFQRCQKKLLKAHPLSPYCEHLFLAEFFFFQINGNDFIHQSGSHLVSPNPDDKTLYLLLVYKEKHLILSSAVKAMRPLQPSLHTAGSYHNDDGQGQCCLWWS